MVMGARSCILQWMLVVDWSFSNIVDFLFLPEIWSFYQKAGYKIVSEVNHEIRSHEGL